MSIERESEFQQRCYRCDCWEYFLTEDGLCFACWDELADSVFASYEKSGEGALPE